MLIINKTKPFYLNEKDKIIRMGNFKNDGKELNFEDDSLIYMFKKLEKPIERNNLINNALDYLIEENFIINYNEYKNILSDNIYSRQNLFLNSLSNKFINYFTNYSSCSLAGKTLMFNIANYELEIISWNKNLNCKECANNASK